MKLKEIICDYLVFEYDRLRFFWGNQVSLNCRLHAFLCCKRL